MDMETTTSFCAAGGCVACGGCGSRSVSTDVTTLSLPVTLTPDSAISTEPVLAVIGLEQSLTWTGGVIGKPVVLTYSFGDLRTLISAESLGTQGDSHDFNEYQKAAWRYAMELHSAASGVQFIEVSDPTKANIAINYQTLSNYTGLGWVSLPTGGQVKLEVNARYYDQIESMDLIAGQNDMLVFLLHEIGHTLGMKHPYVGAVQLAEQFNNRGYTVMSHNSNPDGTYRSDLSPLDKAALQYAYGTQEQQESLSVQWSQLAGGGLISTGNNENNVISGIADRDFVIAGSGNDTISTGSGNDTIDVGLGVNFINAGSGTDILSLTNYLSTDSSFRIVFTNSLDSLNGRSGMFVADGVVNYFSGIEAFEFADGQFVDSGAKQDSGYSMSDILNRVYKIIYGTDAPSSWLESKITAINSGQSTFDRVTNNEIRKDSWSEFRNDGLTESSFSILWERAFGEEAPSWGLNLAGTFTTDYSLVLELARATSSDLFMRTSLVQDPAAAVAGAQISELAATTFTETLDEGEATYGFRIMDATTVRSQRLGQEISDVIRSDTAITVELFDGRIIELPVVEKVRLIDGVIDFRGPGLDTFVSRVFEALAGRDMTAAERLSLNDAIDASSADDAVAQLLTDTEIATRYASMSHDAFARATYRNLLGREPTTAEIQATKSQLAAGATRLEFLQDFVLSEDVISRLSPASEDGMFFFDGSDIWTAAIWDTIFNRALLSPQRDNFSKALDLGGTIQNTISSLLNSTEGTSRYARYTDEEFVGIVYQNAFGHPPADIFVQTALSRLADGATRANIVEDIVRGKVAQLELQEWQHGSEDSATTAFLDRIVGSAESDSLQGRSWSELIEGEAGQDDIHAGSGDDSVLGGAGADSIYGDAGDDTLDGGDGADTLIGGLGVDLMRGGEGDDVYVVDSALDTLVELPNGGRDFVRTDLATYVLSDNIENLIATSATPHHFTGNDLDNSIVGSRGVDTLIGGEGNDTLNGGAGGDLLVGGAGDDVYIVDSEFDSIVELKNDGIDTIRTSLKEFTLGKDIENIYSTNNISHNFTGNNLSNLIVGGSGSDIINGAYGNDTLDGGGGIDKLIGGFGDDFFVVQPGDRVIEYLDRGIDTVFVTGGASYTLGQNLEMLTLGGMVAKGIGNGLDNTITGNNAANTLWGLAGNDWLAGGGGSDVLIGGPGQDTMTGGVGADQFRLTNLADSSIDAPDVIMDFTFGAGERDRISLTMIDANNLASGNQAFVYRGTEFTGRAGDLRVQAQDDGAYIAAGDVDGDGRADFALVIHSTTGPEAGWFLL